MINLAHGFSCLPSKRPLSFPSKLLLNHPGFTLQAMIIDTMKDELMKASLNDLLEVLDANLGFRH